MATLTVCCPTPTTLVSAVTVLNPCPEDIGQIQKMVFWRVGNTIASVATAVISTTWTTLLAATGSTKAIVTPFLGGVVIPPSEAREFGGGNETKGGSPIRKGGASVPVTANMFQVDQDTITALKKLRCESLEVLFINEANQIVYSDTSTFSGFPLSISSLFVSDKAIGGLDDADHNVLMFNLPPNWSDTLEVTAATTFALDMINS